MSYYWFDRKELLEKAHEKYHKESGKEKDASYYQRNKEAIKKKQEKLIKICRMKKKKKREYSRNSFYKLKRQYKG